MLLILLRFKVFRTEGLPSWTLGAVFALKCLLGLLYLWVHLQYYGGGDTANYLRDGDIIFNSLKDSPTEYLMLSLGPNDMPVIPTFIQEQVDAMGYWHDDSAYTMVRFCALVNLFAWGNHYVTAIIMAFLSTLGLWWLFLAFRQVSTSLLPLFIGIFFIPSNLFWTSGIHKEGLMLFFLGAFLYNTMMLLSGPSRIRNVVIAVIAAWFIFTIRDFVFYLLIISMVGAIISRPIPQYTPLIFLSVLCLAAVAAQLIPYHGMDNLFHIVTEKQAQFRALEAGKSQVFLPELQPDLASILSQLPRALYNTLIAPSTFWNGNPFYIIVSLDNLLILAGILFAGFKLKFKRLINDPYLLLPIMAGVCLLLLIGLIVPNVGAIVRYRSIALLLILGSLFAALLPPKPSI